MAATDIGQLSAKQMQRARRVFDIACEYVDRDPDVVKGALTTVNDESTFTVYANDGTYAGEERAEVWAWYGGQAAYREHMRLSLNYDRDAVAGSAETTKDSLNLTQYREMYGYAGMGHKPDPAAIERLMDPDYAVRTFIEGVPGRPGIVRCWLDQRMPAELTIAQRCQWVQGSETLTGENYGEAMHVADQLIEAFGGLPQVQLPEDWFMAPNNWDEAVSQLRTVVREEIGALLANRWAPKDPEAFTEAVKNGVRRAVEQDPDLFGKAIWAHLIESMVSKNDDGTPSHDTAEHFVGYIDKYVHDIVNQPAPGA